MCVKTVVLKLMVAVLPVLFGGTGGAANNDYSDSGEGTNNIPAKDGSVKCIGDQSLPKIAVNTSYRDGNFAGIIHGNDLLLSCSSQYAHNLVIMKGNEYLQSNLLNATTVQFYEKRPNLGEFHYSCVDNNTFCKDSLTFFVIPSILATSPNIQKLNEFSIEDFSKYFVPFGEDFEVKCSGDDVTPLRIDMRLNFEPVNVKYTQINTNSTAIIHIWRENPIGNYGFTCRERASGYDSAIINELTVIVDYIPESQYFWCIIRDWTVLECNWRYSYSGYRSSLLYTDLDGDNKNEIPMCFDILAETYNSFKWNIKHKGQQSFVMNSNFSVTLTTCSSVICNNQTYVMTTSSILKMDQPKFSVMSCNYLRFQPNTIRVASVTDETGWKLIKSDVCEYRVDYRRRETNEAWRQTNIETPTYCKSEYGECELDIRMPYPDTTYELLVYTRLYGATDNRVWSDPTEIDSICVLSRESCACDASSDTTTESTISFETASCEACTLVEDAIKESLDLRNKIEGPLKEKRATAKELSKLLLQSKETAERLKNFSG